MVSIQILIKYELKVGMKVLSWFPTILLVAVVSLILLGCAADRKVVGNTFQSSFPELNIQVDPQFKYLGKETWNGLVNSLSEDREWYIFIPTGAKGRIDKVFYIYIAKAQNSWKNTIPDDKKNLDYGIMKLDRVPYEYFSRIEVPSTGSKLTKYIMDSGYSLPSCTLRRVFVTYPYRDIQATIQYIEDAALSGMSCKNKYSAQTLSDNERGYISSVLHQKALAAFGKSESAAISTSLMKTQEVPKVQIAKPETTVKATVKEEKKRTEIPKIIIRGEKVKVGIIEFQNLNEDAKKENLGTIFSEMLTTSFVNSEAFKITEREQLQKVAEELQLSQSGIIDVTQAKQVGKMVGADAIVTGSVIKIGGDLRLDARIIDVQSGIILTAEKMIGKSDLRSISNMADGIVDNIVNKFYKDKKI